MTDSPLTRRAWVLAAAAGACGVYMPVHAQGFPNKPLTLVVPYPAGGPADATARWLEPGLRKSLGQLIVVDKVRGTGGSLGIQKMLGAPADGHQFLMGTPSDVILTPLAPAAVKLEPQ